MNLVDLTLPLKYLTVLQLLVKSVLVLLQVGQDVRSSILLN